MRDDIDVNVSTIAEVENVIITEKRKCDFYPGSVFESDGYMMIVNSIDKVKVLNGKLSLTLTVTPILKL
jgi:hypothetical protein